jgi:hypothetical protein
MLLGIVPWDTLLVAFCQELGSSNSGEPSRTALGLGMLRLLKFVRLRRMKKVQEYLQYNAAMSLVVFTMIRNYAVALTVTHVSACIMYLLARMENFADDSTWIGSSAFAMVRARMPLASRSPFSSAF